MGGGCTGVPMGVATVGWGGATGRWGAIVGGGGQQWGGGGGGSSTSKNRCSHHKYKTPKLFELKQS